MNVSDFCKAAGIRQEDYVRRSLRTGAIAAERDERGRWTISDAELARYLARRAELEARRSKPSSSQPITSIDGLIEKSRAMRS
jgi:hypothetical protein